MTHDIRRVTVDSQGNLYEVTMMFDREGHLTNEPSLASTCVVVFCGDHIPQDADDIPIYTVH